ncbi:MAG: AAA family ATPase [Phormidesmis sp.]
MAAAISTILPGYYVLETLQEKESTIVYRGMRSRDQQPVIIKLLKADYPSVELITRLKQEYRIPQGIEHSGIVQALSLENYQNRFALVLEDFGGLSLKHLLETVSLPLDSLLAIGIQLADALGAIHQRGIIHKDIKPSNIIFNPLTQAVKLTDFGIASQLSQEVAAIAPPDSLEGTLLYMSPEQTGRMNRAIDYRSDYYSLGVTFYELLSGSLPFESLDPLEVIYCHIANPPAALEKIKPDIPAAVSGVVMKLLAKNAEDRYQTAKGLRADLERCLTEWQTNGNIEPFEPGALDAASQLIPPQRLYGREDEVAALMAAFGRVCQGTAEMVLVSGYSGIGKSSLVNEVHQPITRQRGYFIAGKFDQLNRNLPYSALIQAFQQLVEQILAEPGDRLKTWQAHLSIALAGQGQVLIEVIPDIEALIGPQPQVCELDPAEAQTRFNQILQSFINVFAQPEHPLVLFLDDLQWADLASLQVIQKLMNSGEQGQLMVIGAYRDHEVSPTHPLMKVVEKVTAYGLPLTTLRLKPLAQAHVQALIEDTLKQQSDRLNELANLLFSKSQGNPFFLTQLLKMLHLEGLIFFDFDNQQWQWDLATVQAVGITDQSVVGLVASNIQRLPAATQDLLKLAACIGNTFSLKLLSIIAQQSLATSAQLIWSALQSGLLLPQSKNYRLAEWLSEDNSDDLDLDSHPVAYKFLHDRVQQAAYSLIPEAEKQATHLKIGRLLQQSAQAEVRILDIVNQLNQGIDLMGDRTERMALAQMNLSAGLQAKRALAYSIAATCLEKGLALVGPNGWQQDYEFTLALHQAATATAFLNTEFDRAQDLAETALKNAKTLLERLQIYDLKVQFYLAQNQMPNAIAQAQQVFDLLDISLNESPPDPLDPKTLRNLPELEDPYKLAALRVLSSVVDASAGTPKIFRQIVMTMVRLCVQHGNSRYSAYAYGVYSWLLCGDLQNPALGYEFGKLSLVMLKRYDANNLDCKVAEIFNAFVCHWREPLRVTLQPLQDDVQACLEVGNKDYACFAAMHYACHLFLTGAPLIEVAGQQQGYADMCAEMRRGLQLTYTQVWQQLTANLQTPWKEKAEQPTLLVGEFFDETEALPQLMAENGSFSIFALSIAKLLQAILFGDYEQAIAHIQMAQQHEIKTGLPTTGVFNFYRSLAVLGHCDRLLKTERAPYLQQVQANQQQLQQWAELAPANYQHKHTLVAAEFCRVTGDFLVAMEHYDQAIEGAQRHGYLMDEAMAYERAGQFYLGLKRQEIARTYIVNAYYRYVQWDAIAKVCDLEQRHPDWLLQLSAEAGGLHTTRTATRTTTHSTTRSSILGRGQQELDLATVLKAAQALSGEIVLEKLLPKLITITLENMGAQQGAFVSQQAGTWRQEVIGALANNGVQAKATGIELTAAHLPLQVLQYVARIGRPLVLDNLSLDARFNQDPYVIAQQPVSVLCFPIIRNKVRIGLLYFENNLTPGAFTRDRLELLKMLTSQIAISIENARLYQQAQSTIDQLQQAQLQIVQAEKMSALGNLVAGVAHEINNPLGFLANNLKPAKLYVQDILGILVLYQAEYPEPPDAIAAEIEEINLEFVQEDLLKLLDSMNLGVERIRNISNGLRTFSRADRDHKVPFDLREGIDSTLLILKHRIKATDQRPDIEVVTHYDDVPPIECFPGQLNQVFMNLLANAIDALDEGNAGRSFADIKANPNRITVTLQHSKQPPDEHLVQIQIADNGVGMPPEVQARIFDHLFTTKAVGKGTGLGLAIALQIVTEKHGGRLTVASTPGQGTTFTLQLPIKAPF